MKREGEQVLLRVLLRNTDHYQLRSAADALLERAHTEGLAGATVIRGIYGMDVGGRLLQGSGWSLVEHVPVILEMVDTSAAIGKFLPALEQIIPEGVATLERAHVLIYRHRREAAGRSAAPLAVPLGILDLSTLPAFEDVPAMKLSEAGQQVRIFIGESDAWRGEPLYRAIVQKARELGLANATVLRGTLGFGANSRVHSSQLLETSAGLPLIVEIVDSADRIQSLLPFLDESMEEGFITIESVQVLKYQADRKRS